MAKSEHRQDKPPARLQAAYHHGDLRAALIAAAEDLLAEKGAEGFTLRECARRVGVSPAAPSHHFGNAAGLLATIATMGFDELSDTMEAALAGLGPAPAPRLAAIGKAYVAFARSRPGRFRVTFGTAAHAAKHLEPELARAGARAHAILEREVGATPAGAGNLQAATTLNWAAVHGLSLLLLDGTLAFMPPDDAARDALVDEVTNLLAAATSRPKETT